MKRIALAVLISFFGFTATAQGIDLGIKVGANFANISDAADFDSKTGFVGGIFLGLKLSDNFTIQPELLYSQQGADFDLGDFDLTYINVPIIFKYYLVKGLNIQAGPQFGFVVDDDISELPGELENAVDTNNFDTSGVVGLGYDLPFGLQVSARYNFGLTEINDGGGKNSVISLAVGFSFL